MKKYDGAGDFVNDRFEEICSHEKLYADEVIYFLISFSRVYVSLLSFLTVKLFLHMKCRESLGLRKSLQTFLLNCVKSYDYWNI